MELSIIVPVYNVKDYLPYCLDSIVNQEGSTYEVLLVDDGSFDGSSEICDCYAQNYNMIKVYHKPNGGLSDARNYGIERAKGDYLIFVDSDDWVKEGSFQKICLCLKESRPDVLLTRIIEYKAGKEIFKDKNIIDVCKKTEKISMIEWLMRQSQNTWPAVTKIVSNRFVQSNSLRFMVGRKHEDLDWTCNLCYCAEKIIAEDISWYCHRMEREGSIGNTIRGENIIDVIEMAQNHYTLYKKNKNKLNSLIVNRVMESVYTSINKVGKCTEEDKQHVIDCIKSHKEIFEITPTFKSKLFAYYMKLFSVEAALRLIK